MNGTEKNNNSKPMPSKEEMQRKLQDTLGSASKSSSSSSKNSNSNKTADISSSNKPSKKSKDNFYGASASKNAADEKAEKMRQIKASIASANQGIYKEKTSADAAAEARKYVRRRQIQDDNFYDDDYYDYNYSKKRTNPNRRPPANYNRNQYRYNEQSSSRAAKIGVISLCVIVMILLIIYLIGYFSSQNKLLHNTFINGIDVSGMTVSEAEQAVLDNGAHIGITFRKKSGEEVFFDGSEFGSVVSLPENALKPAAEESHVLWFSKYFKPSEYTITLINTYSESELSDKILTYNWGTTPPTDAYLQRGTDGVYTIIPEDNGDMIEPSVLANYALMEMKGGNNYIDMEKSECYLSAEITTGDLKEALEACNKLAGLTITYDFEDGRIEELDSLTIADWISADSKGNVIVAEDKATAWVEEHLTQYDTYVPGYTRTFNSTMQGQVEVPLGDYSTYGWKTDVEASAKKLVEYIKEGESKTVEPEYERTGYCRGIDDIGKSYVEVDLTNQHVWLYKNGELVIDSDCVTGTANDPSRETHPCIGRVKNMSQNEVLQGEGYSTPVSYWMDFTDVGIGLHDAGWRGSFGGEIYKSNGSHGCVNLPPDVAQTIYENIEIGFPVIVIP
ncbi:MAG: L,D-transpeptidase family protein [Ruminococcus sp.]|nr:L,D-transpeptidase family protein [Ruminococcus sp.]